MDIQIVTILNFSRKYKTTNLETFVQDLLAFIKANKEIKNYIKSNSQIELKTEAGNIFTYERFDILKKIIKCIHYILIYRKCEKIPKTLIENLLIDTNISNDFIICYIRDNFDFTQINTQYRSEKSYNKYPLDLLKSALQKYIRRGILDKAIYFAIEICLFMFTKTDTNQKRIITNFIHRLQVIFLEDVGIGCYDEWENIDTLFDELWKRDNSTFIFAFVNLVKMMTLNSHIRISSHYSSLRTVIKVDKNLEKMRDYIKYFPSFKKYYDLILQHSEKNILVNYIKSFVNKSIDCGFWIRELEDKQKLTSSIIDRIYLPLKDVKYASISKKWSKELNGLRERFLPYYSTILYNYFELDKKEEKSVYIISKISNFELLRHAMINLKEKLEIDDFAVDMHTKLGKQRQKGVKDFVYEGSKVENEYYINDEASEWKDFYNFTKLLYQEDIVDKQFLKEYRNKSVKENAQSIEKESDVFQLVVRSQLVTSPFKQDTYYGIDRRDNIVKFVKGPYLENSKIEIIEDIKNVRKVLNEPYINFDVLYLVPDLLDSPLSIRNKAIKDKKYPFLVYENVIKEKLITRIHSSKLWPETEVVDYDKMKKYKFDPKNCSKDIFRQYIIHLLFRAMLGVSDIADRNFIIVDDILYSVDEETLNDNLSIEFELRKAKYNLALDFIKDNKDMLRKIVDSWKVKIEKSDLKLRDRVLTRLQTNEFVLMIYS